MKIIYVIETLDSCGGAENSVVNIALELKSRGHDVSIAFLHEPNHFVKILNNKQIEFICLNLKHRWDLVSCFFKLRKYLKRKNPEIVNAINFFPMLYLSLASIPGKKFKSFVTYHNLGYDSYPADTIYKTIRKKIDIFLNKNFINCHVAVSEAVGKSYQKHLKLKKINIINNIIPIQNLLKYSKISKKKNKIPKLIMTGRLIREKGYHYMLEAAKILKKKNIAFVLSIYGNGILKNEIEKKIKEDKLSKYIFIHKPVDHKILFKKIRQSDIFVMSSTHEGLPMALIEAMTIGTCIVATKAGGICELIKNKHTGILVPVCNEKKLALRIEKLLTNHNLQKKISYNAQKRVLNDLNEDIIIKSTIDLYKKQLQIN